MVNQLLMIGTTELLFIAIIVLVLFGGKRIPELMKGLGKGIRSFKEGMNGNFDDEETSASQEKRDVPAEAESAAEAPASDEQKK